MKRNIILSLLLGMILSFQAFAAESVTINNVKYKLYLPTQTVNYESGIYQAEIIGVANNASEITIPYSVFYNGNEYWDRQTDATTSQTGNNYQVTYPIYWVYTDADGDTLKIDTVRNVTHASDSWTSYSSPHSTHPASRLRAEDIYPKYGEITDSLLVIPVTRTLYNAQGCPIYTRTDNIKFRKRWRYTTAARYTQYWYSNYGQSYYDYCCQNERYVYVYGGYLNNIYMDSTIVELYESPLGNKYNFRAVYHLDTHSWTYEKDSISNLARLSFSGYSNIYMYDYCLPSGLYKYRIITKCDTFYTSTQPGFNDTYSWFYDEPEYELTYECTNLTIKPKYKYFYKSNVNTLIGNIKEEMYRLLTDDKEEIKQIVEEILDIARKDLVYTKIKSPTNEERDKKKYYHQKCKSNIQDSF